MNISYFSGEAIFSAGGVLVDMQGEKVLLVYKQKTGEWLLPKGHMEEGETIEEAANREIFEETGFQNTIKKLLSVQVRPDIVDPSKSKVIFWFRSDLTTGSRQENTQMSDENFKGEWFSKEEAIEKLKWEDDKTLVTKCFN